MAVLDRTLEYYTVKYFECITDYSAKLLLGRGSYMLCKMCQILMCLHSMYEPRKYEPFAPSYSNKELWKQLRVLIVLYSPSTHRHACWKYA